MIKILIAHSSLGNGGITNVLKELVKNIDHTKYQIDLCMYEGGKTDAKDDFEAFGCHVYEVCNPKKDYETCKKQMEQLQKENSYTVIHSCNYFNSGYLMQIGKELGIPVRIVHAHASQDFQGGILYKFYKSIMRRKINKYATDFIACSDKAGEFLFGNHPFELIENPINAEAFTYSLELRHAIRQEYQIDDSIYLLGMVGMISTIKNQSYVLDILKQLPETYHLMIVGDGQGRDELETKIDLYNLEERVHITGWVKDPARYYSAFDVFLMPSLSEGFPLAGLESQANGLQVLFSDHVTKALKQSDAVTFLPIQQEDVALWKDKILELSKENHLRTNVIQGTNFDSKLNIKKWEALYQKG